MAKIFAIGLVGDHPENNLPHQSFVVFDELLESVGIASQDMIDLMSGGFCNLACHNVVD